jgi:hypothetical protein
MAQFTLSELQALNTAVSVLRIGSLGKGYS